MGYKLLGWVAWNGAKWVLRRKYGRAMMPLPVLAGGVVLAALGVAFVARRSGGGSE
jgi:hypothetical protein